MSTPRTDEAVLHAPSTRSTRQSKRRRSSSADESDGSDGEPEGLSSEESESQDMDASEEEFVEPRRKKQRSRTEGDAKSGFED